MHPIKVLIVGDNAFARSIIEKLSSDINEQRLELISISNQERPNLSCENICLSALDIEQIIDIAIARHISLTIVCCDKLINSGIAEKFEEAGLNILAPDLTINQICFSNYNFKEFMHRHCIPSTPYVSFDNEMMSVAYLSYLNFPIIIKPDFIFETNYERKAFIAKDLNDATAFIQEYFSQPLLSTYKKRLIIEEYNETLEICISLIYDGKTVLSLIPTKTQSEYNEYALSFEEKFSNTINFDIESIKEELSSKIIDPFIKGLQTEGKEFKGFLTLIIRLNQEGEMVLSHVDNFAPELSSEIMFDLLDENLFDLLFSCSQKKLNFYRDGLHYSNLSGVGLDLQYDKDSLPYLNEDSFLQIEKTALDANYRIKVQILSGNNRDSVRLFVYAPTETEAKNFAKTVALELNLLDQSPLS